MQVETCSYNVPPVGVFSVMSCGILIGWLVYMECSSSHTGQLFRRPSFCIDKERFHHVSLTIFSFPLGKPKVTQSTSAFGDSRVTKVIRFNVLLLGAYSHLRFQWK